MSKAIPTYFINHLSGKDGHDSDVLLITEKVDTSRAAFDLPFRSHYYGVGICLKGNAELRANLEAYSIVPNCIIAMPPEVIKQWVYMSGDFETFTVFFTKDFLTTNNTINPDKFPFFEPVANHCFSISKQQAALVVASLNFIKEKYNAPHFFKNVILKNLINVLLYDVSSVYEQQNSVSNSVQTRSELISANFKQLVTMFFLKERSLRFYADRLSVTPKHLTETVKEITGKTAGEWIDETVVLEAKVLLQNPDLTVSQITDILHFSDQSVFGKFFKNLVGLSPIAYRKSVS